MEQAGWKVVDYHRAILFQEMQQGDLFGSTRKKIKGRMSFFRRLAWAKGSPVVSYEHVIIAVRANSADFMTGIGARPALPAEYALPMGQQDA